MTSATTFSLVCYVLYTVCSATAFSGPNGPSIKPTPRDSLLTVHNSQEEGNNEQYHLQRRQVLSQTVNLLLLPTLLASSPQAALAAAPITLKDTDSLAAIAKRKLRAKPPKVLRRKLSIDFAVLLMRSSYNALDSLDCVAMVRMIHEGTNERTVTIINHLYHMTFLSSLLIVAGSISKRFRKSNLYLVASTNNIDSLTYFAITVLDTQFRL